MSLASAGFSAFGPYGALAGASLGVALDFGKGYFDDSFVNVVTNSFLGYSVLTIAVNPAYSALLTTTSAIEYAVENMCIYHVLNFGVAAASFVASTANELGVFTTYPKVMNAAAMTGMGAYNFGPIGAIAGALSVPVDELLKSYNVTDNNISQSSITSATFLQISDKSITAYRGNPIRFLENNFLNKLLFAGSSLITGYLLAKDTEVTKVELHRPVEVHSILTSEVKKIIDSKVTDEIMQNKFLAETGIGTISLSSLNQAVMRFNNLKAYGLDIIKARQQGKDDSIEVALFIKEIGCFSLNVASFFTSNFASKYASEYYRNKFFISVYDGIFNQFMKDDIPLKFDNIEGGKELINSLSRHVYTLSSNGLSISSDILESYQSAIFGSFFTYSSNAVDTLMSVFGYNTLVNFVTKSLGEWQAQQSIEMRSHENKYRAQLQNLHANSKVISEGRGVEFVKSQLKEIEVELRSSQIEGEQINFLSELWYRVLGWSNYLASFASIIGFTDISGMDLGKVSSLTMHASNAASIFSWTSSNSAKLTSLEYAINSIKRIQQILNVDIEEKSTDDIIRLFNEDELLLNLNISIPLEDNKHLIEFKNVSLKPGEIYALTGPSGSGKSSANSKIIGIEHNGIKGEGSIKYPSEDLSQVTLVTQSDYIPLDSSLYEVFMYPRIKENIKTLNNTYAPRAIEVVNSLGVSHIRDLASELHDIRNWEAELSGGQKKILSLVRGLLSDAKIIIFDEVFTGLDKKLLINAQKLIKKYAEEHNAIIISVDHSAHDNNFEGFYNLELYVEDHQIKARGIESKDIPASFFIDDSYTEDESACFNSFEYAHEGIAGVCNSTIIEAA
ncbi:MAG: ATP-binding cassette domain-containing protein [Rickettsiales bacterium]